MDEPHTWFDTMVVNYVDDEWQSRHMTVGLFEALDTLRFVVAEVVKCMLQPSQLANKVVAYVKDDSSNLATLVASLSSMVAYMPFGMTLPHVGTCYEQGICHNERESLRRRVKGEDIKGSSCIAKNHNFDKEQHEGGTRVG